MEPTSYDNVGGSNTQNLYDNMVSSPIDVENTEPFVDNVEAMVNDVMITNEVGENEQPNVEAQAFYNMLHAAHRLLWDGCSNQTELLNAIKLMSIKSDYNMSQNYLNEVMQLMHESYRRTIVSPEITQS